MNTPPPSLKELLATAQIVQIPTRTRFRGITLREAMIFDGPTGASEFSPFPEYDDTESSTWLQAAIDYGWNTPPTPTRKHIEVNATVPAITAQEVPDILKRFPGCRTVKIKVAAPGQHLTNDIARVRAVRHTLGENALIRVDANGNWSVSQAFHALNTLAPYGIDYAEQPCATINELAQLRHLLAHATTPVRIAADESVRRSTDPLAVARAGAADLLVLKAQPLGGIRQALTIVEAATLPVVISSALDTSVGISMGAHLAAALPESTLAGACGLGTAALLNGDITDTPLLPVHGSIEVRRPTLNPSRIRKFRAPAEREHWWRERLTRCYALISPHP